MLILFYVSLAAVGYVYFGYPLVLWIGAFGRKQTFRRGDGQPLISVIVAAHNEESQIAAKIHNLIESKYPRDRVEILIGSDGSSDKTEDIVREFTCEGVGLLSFPQQQGKSAIQNGLVAVASGDILVFTDADCFFAPDALSFIVENFADPRVGLVTAHPRYLNESETSITENESIYLRYETWLRRQESDRGLMAMASGSLFALRRSLWHPLKPGEGYDFVCPLRVAQAGMLNRLDDRVAAVTRLTQDQPAAMLRMKTRIIGKDFRGLLSHGDLLNPIVHGSLAAGLWSHKLLRWLVPYFLLALMASNLALPGRPFFRAVFALQATFYALALVGLAARGRSDKFPFSVPASFCIVNFAALQGTLSCFAGKTSGRWIPERNSSPAAEIDPAATARGLK